MFLKALLGNQAPKIMCFTRWRINCLGVWLVKVPNQLASSSPHRVHLVKVDLIETKKEPQQISTNLFSTCFIASFHLMWSRTFHGRFILHVYHPQILRCPYIDVFFLCL